MSMQLVTGNHAAGHSLSLAAEANRNARGSVCGIYPITPQTEIVEYVARQSFTKGTVIPVESEHSAMGVCIGASLNGARSFTASSSNGLAYMAENAIVAAYYRLPIVMPAVNRTLGPPWNIWSDQGDTLMFRDFPWIQFYCDSNQDVADTTLLAFRLAEDSRIMLPVMVCMDAFIVSHTSMEIELASQDQVDQFLPDCKVPHRIDPAHPVTVGGMSIPQETLTHRNDIDAAMIRVPEVLEEHRSRFREIFGRNVSGALTAYRIEDADRIFIASGTVSITLKDIVDECRAGGEKVGMIRVKQFNPFPGEQLAELCSGTAKIGVLDRNYSAGTGGIFWQEVRACMQGRGDHLIQGYLAGVGGGDVVPETVRQVVSDLDARSTAISPIWKGLEQ